MQELTRSVQQRIAKTKEVIERGVNSQIIRHLREQQKTRCQKEGFILSMMRSNKLMSSTLKKLYYKNSHELMILLEPAFEFKVSLTVQEDFLNDFVHLYTAFFNHFQSKFTFKTKVKNFLRPTNQNLIIDLVKYFVDFTRDYYVQTLFWKMRGSLRSSNLTLSEQQISNFVQNQEESSPTKVKPLGSICRNNSNFVQATDNNLRKKTDEAEQKKNNFNIYEILEVSTPCLSINFTKQNPANIESLKIKINQLFRDQKSRNSSNKQICQDFYESYKQKYNKNQNSSLPIPYISFFKRSDRLNAKCLPYKMYLSIQKNGFSGILLQVDNKKLRTSYLTTNLKFQSYSNVSSYNNSPSKASDNSLSPLKISLRLSETDQSFKSDYFLASMKVLRVSQNFLPPLISSNMLMNNLSPSKKDIYQKQAQNKSQKSDKQGLLPFSIKLKRMTDQIEEAVPFANQLSSSSNVLVRSTSYKKSTLQKQRKRLQSYNKQIYSGDYVNGRQSGESKKRRQSEESNYRLSTKKLSVKKKFFDERKSLQGGGYLPSYNYSKQSAYMNHQSEQKILQWLQKIKNLKQIERKKILGMNF